MYQLAILKSNIVVCNTMDLFEDIDNDGVTGGPSSTLSAPLAERMRPLKVSDLLGQEHLIGEGRFLQAILKGTVESVPSLILWGPPGSGKTTLSRIIARASGAEFIEFSAVLSGVKEIRGAIERAKELACLGRRTILFVDEIHRFNKSQQDAFLHSIEEGTITLIGATTENPSFEVNGPLLSRCKVLTVEGMDDTSMAVLLKRAISDKVRGLGEEGVLLSDEAIDFISANSNGDARKALNTLEVAALIAERAVKAEEGKGDGKVDITVEILEEAMQQKALLYDKSGDEHYNVISAFIKSMRGSDPDGALYYLARMIESGEDPMFIARRMVIFASEDVGVAAPHALSVAVSVKDALHFVGMPEGWIPLAQGVVYLATAPKSNSSYKAYKEALRDVRKMGAPETPKHIRNAPTKLMKESGYGAGYKYPHNYEDAYVEEEYLPEELKGRSYYKPTDRGYEKGIAEEIARKIKGKKGKGKS